MKNNKTETQESDIPELTFGELSGKSKFDRLLEEDGFIEFTKKDHKNNAYGDLIIIGMVDGSIFGADTDEFSIQKGINFPMNLDGGFILFQDIDTGETICKKVSLLSKAFPTSMHGSIRVIDDCLTDILDIQDNSGLSRTQALGIVPFIGYELLPEERCGDYTLEYVIDTIKNYVDANKSKIKKGRFADVYKREVNGIVSGISGSMLNEGIDITDVTMQMSMSSHYIMYENKEKITRGLVVFLKYGNMFKLDVIATMRGLIEFTDWVDEETRAKYRIVIDNFCDDVWRVAKLLDLDFMLKYKKM